jgi:RHS repeat-associated protein
VWDRSQIVEKHEIDADTYWQFTWGAFTNQLLETREYDTSSGSPQLANKFVPLADHRQSVTAVWDALAGEMKSVYDYDPHGRVTASFANETVRCQEQGNPDTVCLTESGMGIGTNVRSPVTGMVYMRNRWYSPRLAQFVSPDPAGHIDSYNVYGYVGMDPINYWDPWGLASTSTPNSNKSVWTSLGLGTGVGEVVKGNRQMSNAGAEGGRAVERGADEIGRFNDKMSRGMIEWGQRGKRRYAHNPVLRDLSAYVAFQGEMAQIVLPTTGDEVMFDVAMAPAGLIGRGGGLADEVAAAADDGLQAASKGLGRGSKSASKGRRGPPGGGKGNGGGAGGGGGDDSGVYIPRDGDGNVVPLPKQKVNGQDLPLPDPAANGAPHTRLGGKVSSGTGKPYRQSAHFPGPSDPKANGEDVPLRQVDWTDHGQPHHHTNPHQHPFPYDFDNGFYRRGEPIPFVW